MTDLDGGITIPDAPTITDEHKKLVEEARKTLDDSSEAIPFALLGTQSSCWDKLLDLMQKSTCLAPHRVKKLVTLQNQQNPQDEVTLLEATTFEF